MEEAREELWISESGVLSRSVDASGVYLRFRGFCLAFSVFDLSRKEKVGLRALTLGGVICSCAVDGGEEGGVMVDVPSSSCDSSEKMVLFFREGEDDSAATEVSRMARSRLSSSSINIDVFSLFEN